MTPEILISYTHREPETDSRTKKLKIHILLDILLTSE